MQIIKINVVLWPLSKPCQWGGRGYKFRGGWCPVKAISLQMVAMCQNDVGWSVRGYSEPTGFLAHQRSFQSSPRFCYVVCWSWPHVCFRSTAIASLTLKWIAMAAAIANPFCPNRQRAVMTIQCVSLFILEIDSVGYLFSFQNGKVCVQRLTHTWQKDVQLRKTYAYMWGNEVLNFNL